MAGREQIVGSRKQGAQLERERDAGGLNRGSGSVPGGTGPAIV